MAKQKTPTTQNDEIEMLNNRAGRNISPTAGYAGILDDGTSGRFHFNLENGLHRPTRRKKTLVNARRSQ